MIRFILDLIRFDLLNWIWDYLFSKLLILWDFWIFLMLEYYIGMQGFYKFHQISLLCDHQELACTPKDPPRRVDMNERSLIFFIIRIIELSTKPFENLLFWTCWKTAYALFDIGYWTFRRHFYHKSSPLSNRIPKSSLLC